MLHQIPRIAERNTVDQGIRADEFVEVGFPGGEVVVVGHKIDFIAPVGIIQLTLPRCNHEVGGERLAGAYPFDCRTLGNIELFQRIRTETLIIKLMRGVRHRVITHMARKDHTIKTADLLCPEGCAPGGVEGINSVVAVFAPLLEGALSII